MGDFAYRIDAGMQGLIAIVLGKADIIVEGTGNRFEMGTRRSRVSWAKARAVGALASATPSKASKRKVI